VGAGNTASTLMGGMVQVGVDADIVGVGDSDGVDRRVGVDGNGGSIEARSGESAAAVNLSGMSGGKNAGSVVTDLAETSCNKRASGFTQPAALGHCFRRSGRGNGDPATQRWSSREDCWWTRNATSAPGAPSQWP
jgi:hypothetical protein